MKWFLLSMLAVAILYLGERLLKHRSLYPMLPFRYDFRKRRNSFRMALQLLERINARVLIETGTAREGLKGSKSQGAATVVFGLWAKRNSAILHSVDIDPVSLAAARAEIERQGLTTSVRLHESDSVEFLANFDGPVDFLYLDSFDYSKTDQEIQRESQKHHLKELKAIENHLHETSIVLIDDCGLPNGGKGKLVVDYLLARGWKVALEDYQVLLVREHFQDQ